MSLLDDLEHLHSSLEPFGDCERCDGAKANLEAALRLLDQPGARQWLEALPGLIELGHKATPGPWKAEVGRNPDDPGCGALAPLHQCDDFDCPEGDCNCEEKAQADSNLIAALRNAINECEKEG